MSQESRIYSTRKKNNPMIIDDGDDEDDFFPSINIFLLNYQ